MEDWSGEQPKPLGRGDYPQIATDDQILLLELLARAMTSNTEGVQTIDRYGFPTEDGNLVFMGMSRVNGCPVSESDVCLGVYIFNDPSSGNEDCPLFQLLFNGNNELEPDEVVIKPEVVQEAEKYLGEVVLHNDVSPDERAVLSNATAFLAQSNCRNQDGSFYGLNSMSYNLAITIRQLVVLNRTSRQIIHSFNFGPIGGCKIPAEICVGVMTNKFEGDRTIERMCNLPVLEITYIDPNTGEYRFYEVSHDGIDEAGRPAILRQATGFKPNERLAALERNPAAKGALPTKAHYPTSTFVQALVHDLTRIAFSN